MDAVGRGLGLISALAFGAAALVMYEDPLANVFLSDTLTNGGFAFAILALTLGERPRPPRGPDRGPSGPPTPPVS